MNGIAAVQRRGRRNRQQQAGVKALMPAGAIDARAMSQNGAGVACRAIMRD